MKNNRAYLLRTEITKSHLGNHICQYCSMKTSLVTPSFYHVFNISLYCNDSIQSFVGNLWWFFYLGVTLIAFIFLKVVFGVYYVFSCLFPSKSLIFCATHNNICCFAQSCTMPSSGGSLQFDFIILVFK